MWVADSEEREKENTYDIQVLEFRSHSFALYFPPEGDFAPEAHCDPNEVCTVLDTHKKEKTKKENKQKLHCLASWKKKKHTKKKTA